MSNHGYGNQSEMSPPTWGPPIPASTLPSAPTYSAIDVAPLPALDAKTGIFIPGGFVPAPGPSQGSSANQYGAINQSPSPLPSAYPRPYPIGGVYRPGVPPGDGGYPPPPPGPGLEGGDYPQPQPPASYGVHGPHSTGLATAQQHGQSQYADNERRWAGGLCEWCHPGGDLDGYCLCCLAFWCPCISFGRMMERAGFGGSLQCSTLYVLVCVIPCLVLFVTYVVLLMGAVAEAGYVALAFLLVTPVCFGLWGGYHRSALRKKFRLHGDRLTDSVLHTCCHYCTLCQEYRTMSINVHEGRWTGQAPEAVPVGPVLVPPRVQSM